MNKLLSLFVFVLYCTISYGQIAVDLEKSVPWWLDYNMVTNEATLRWDTDPAADAYALNEISYSPTTLTPIGALEGTANQYALGELIPGQKYGYLIKKDFVGEGVITLGLQVPAVHERGRCLVAIDDLLAVPLDTEIVQLIEDLSMDGWQVDTINVPRTVGVVAVKARVVDWYDTDYDSSQALFILGHVAVPYSGNSAHDGHGDHQGAWAADVFYGEIDGEWTDETVNNTTPSRVENDNIPGDGKYDQTSIPTQVEIEVGRVDFNNLPAFTEDEIELTRQYLNKSHSFKTGENVYPRRGLVENNFGSFAEGFGQTGWRNFTTMFGADSVSIQNYDVVLETEKYLCSYACGGGSYTSASGIGTTSNLWVAKDIQTVFTFIFGSYFGDWDSQNNFLRSALASGDVLTNAWAGRPVWQVYDMALGQHIGFSAKATQNAPFNIFNAGSSSTRAHIALMGDPTLRLHAVKPANNLVAEFITPSVNLSWEDSADASDGYFIYRRADGENWNLIEEFHPSNSYTDACVMGNTSYEYMVKAIRLEQTGSGTYYNTSLGITTSIQSGENLLISSFFEDSDMDGFGNSAQDTLACSMPVGFVANDLDCDDTDAAINPDAIDIPNNGIDEDCTDGDLVVGLEEFSGINLRIFPNPTDGQLFIDYPQIDDLDYRLYNSQGQVLQSGELTESVDLSDLPDGMYWLEVILAEHNQFMMKKIIVKR